VKKARLGFKIYSLDSELLVDEDRDIEFRAKQKKWLSRKKELARKLRCYNKNKEKYNAQRRDVASSIGGRFKVSKTKAKTSGQEWLLSEKEWQDIWIEAGWVVVPGTISPQRPGGVRRTAYSMRGPNKFENTMMARKDLSKAWSKDNCYIVFRSEPLIGSPYHLTAQDCASTG